MTTTPQTLDDAFYRIKTQVNATIAEHLGHSVETFGLNGSDMDSVFGRALKNALSGGKRFRALSAVVGAATAVSLQDETLSPVELLETVVSKELLALAAALEFYQAAALVHDDVIDRASERRGKPSFHYELAEMTQGSALTEDHSHYGVSAAILAGDLLIAAATLTLEQAAMAEVGKDMRLRFSTMMGEVAYGQFLDLEASHANLDSTPAATERALQVVRLKSARYSVAHPVALGALQALGGAGTASILERIFEPAGMAFQLRDDDLGVFGDALATGKSTSGDLVEKKRTVLLGLTYQNANSQERELLSSIFSASEPLTASQIPEIRQIFADRGRGSHELEITRLQDLSAAELAHSGLPPAAIELCSAFIKTLVARSS